MLELLLSPFTLMGAVFILAPLAGLAPTIIFLTFYFKQKRGPILLAAIIWAAYTVYEFLMHARILCSGECNIRVDLLVIYPLIWAVSIIAIVSIFRGRRSLAVKTEGL
jgi:hypothetical protein